MLVGQGKNTVYALCPNGCRVFGISGQSLSELLEDMPHEIVKVRDGELIILDSPKDSEETPAHSQQGQTGDNLW
jgi:hypothetical protein